MVVFPGLSELPMLQWVIVCGTHTPVLSSDSCIVPFGHARLAHLRQEVGAHLSKLGNCHWGDQMDVQNLSQVFDVGVLLFCDRLQDQGRQCLYNIGSQREVFPYWVSLWWDEPFHFRLAQLAFAEPGAARGTCGHTCFWADAALPSLLREQYRYCNRMAN